MIVIGTYFIQSQSIDDFTILAGIVVGILSSLVLFVTSIPDHDVDKEKGRRTLIIIFGKPNALRTYLNFSNIGIWCNNLWCGIVVISYLQSYCFACQTLLNSILHLK